MRITRVFTRQGDDGATGLGGGHRVFKDSPRVKAYGAVDELNSAIGQAIAAGLSPRAAEPLLVIQNELFHLGADLCFLDEDKAKHKIPQIEERHVQKLEGQLKELNEIVGPLQNFILPGGSPASAVLHVARAVCRRAEREVVALAREEIIGRFVIPYLNRLSDLLFVLARYENKVRGVAEPLWDETA